ncbi:MAG: ImmA/IrrE family metallo-endopeptidase [Tissierellales bacterium]|nr:ImmA/IrrE family metallo-endopeptidase [Tissierellales bacterium]
MSTVNVKGKVLQWALERSYTSIEEIKDKFPKIEEWIDEASMPTLRQLESFAKATHTPFGFLFLDEPPKESAPIPYYRTFGDEGQVKPSLELIDTIRSMEQRQSWMREYLVEQGEEPLQFVKSSDIRESIILIAERMREALGLEDRWASKFSTWTDALRALREAMEVSGILVVGNGIVGNNTRRRLQPGEFRGFVLVDNYSPLVFVNNSDGKAAQMFTLAHELAHIFFGSSAAFDLRQMQPADDPVEKACDRVAAEFLIPSKEIQDIWPSIQGENEPLQKLARNFKVSVLVAARRALDLGFITKDEFFEFYERYKQDERRKSSIRTDSGDFYANQNLRVGRHFGTVVVSAVKEGKLLYSEAYQLTGLHGKTFQRYAESLGFGGA